ncbi:MAG: hypothetical protein LBS27_10855 [Bifidobacteriaceae bacterium]|nr:hypothetical protein [Bifidobacteriaceae bacterium]
MQNADFELQLANAVDWWLDRVQEALEGILIVGPTPGAAPIDQVVEACDRVRCQSVRAELDAEVVSILIDSNNYQEARELTSGRLAQHVLQAQYHAAQADSAARQIAGYLEQADRTIEQAQSLLSLAAQSGWAVDHEWLRRAVARSANLRSRLAEAEQESRSATEAAFLATAHAVTARVAHGLAEVDLERAELSDQIAQIGGNELPPRDNHNRH